MLIEYLASVYAGTAGETLWSQVYKDTVAQAASIYGVVSANGGFVPRTRARRRSALTLFEREEISRGPARYTLNRSRAAYAVYRGLTAAVPAVGAR